MAKKKVTTKAVTTKEEIIDTVDINADQQDCAADNCLVSCKNTTNRNIFTTLGRVGGGKKIQLLQSECTSTAGLSID